MRKLLEASLLIALLSATFVFAIFPVKADSWLEGWNYRKSHVIKASSGSGSNYQVGFKLYYGSGSDGIENMYNLTFGKAYLKGFCRSDFGDIRFTKSDGITLLDCWIEQNVTSNYIICWVEMLDDLSTDDQTIYVYYGNSTATYPYGNDQTEMDNTFVFADHFYGSAYNTTKWSRYYGFYPFWVLEVTVKDSIIYVCNNDTSPFWASIGTQQSFTNGYSAVFNASFKADWQQLFFSGSNNPSETPQSVIRRHSTLEHWYSTVGYDPYHFEHVESNILKDTDWHIFEQRRNGTHDQSVVDGSNWYNNNYSSSHAEWLWLGSAQPNSFNITSDYAFVRKYNFPEPQHDIWGEATKIPSLFIGLLFFSCVVLIVFWVSLKKK